MSNPLKSELLNGTDPLRNPKDPLHRYGPQAGQHLFRAFAQVANGFPYNAAIDAAVNIIINVTRQENQDWRHAERAFDEMFGRAKQALKDHYDSVSGRKKGIFPYHQVIGAPFHDDRDTPYRR